MEIIVIFSFFYLIYFVVSLLPSSEENEVRKQKSQDVQDVVREKFKVVRIKRSTSGCDSSVIKRLSNGKFADIQKKNVVDSYTLHEYLTLKDNLIRKLDWRDEPDLADLYISLKVYHAIIGPKGISKALLKDGQKFYSFKKKRKEDSPFIIGEMVTVRVSDLEKSFAADSHGLDDYLKTWNNPYVECEIIERLGFIKDKDYVIVECERGLSMLNYKNSKKWDLVSNYVWLPISGINNYNIAPFNAWSISYLKEQNKWLKDMAVMIPVENSSLNQYLVNCKDKRIEIRYEEVRKYSVSELNKLTLEERDKIYFSLNNGVIIIDNELQLDMYNFSYGNMHLAKLKQAIPKLKFENKGKTFCLIDYGCGQGIGSLTLLRYLNKKSDISKLEKITLIEPSVQALSRAYTIIRNYREQNNLAFEIILLNKDLNEITKEHLQSTAKLSIHVLSNILDIPEIKNDRLLRVINESGLCREKEYFLCTSPKFTSLGNDLRTKKVKEFAMSLDGLVLSERSDDIGEWKRQELVITRKLKR